MKMSPAGIRTFLQAANENELDCLKEYPDLVEFIDRVEGLFRELLGSEWDGNPLCALLLMNSHASFLAAVRVALSAQIPPTHMVLRGALESALFCLIASQSEDNRSVWLNRDKDRKRCRKLYTAKNAIRLLKDDPGLLDLLNEGYDLSIDFGGHPNRQSVTDHVSIEDHEKHNRVSLTHLHAPSSTQTLRAIAACIEIGLAIIFVSPHALPGHPKAVDLHAEAIKVRQEYDEFIKSRYKSE
jgi:hypothetical protein